VLSHWHFRLLSVDILNLGGTNFEIPHTS
jgi:hypothetical protein